MIKAYFEEYKEDFAAIAFFILLPCIYLKSALFFSDAVLGSSFSDIRVECYEKLFGSRELSNFSLPLWNPYQFGGMPFMALPGSAFFYPLNRILGFLPIHYAINWSIAIHLLLSETFTYFLLRHYGVNRSGSILGGIVYAFSAPQIMHIFAGHAIAITSMPWTPLLLLLTDKFVSNYDMPATDGTFLKGVPREIRSGPMVLRPENEPKNHVRFGILLSLAIALQFLAGYTQYLFYSLITISFYFLALSIKLYSNGRALADIGKKSLLFIFFVFFGIALSAVQLLPALELMTFSTRGNLSFEWVSSFSFPPENLITLILPDFFGDMGAVAYWGKNFLWEMTAYVGIIPLLLAFVAFLFCRRGVARFFSCLAILSIILAMGSYTPLLKFLYQFVPGFNLFRGNSKFIFLTALSLSLLSGFGLDSLIKEVHDVKRFRLSILFFFIILSTGLSVLFFVPEQSWFKERIEKTASLKRNSDSPPLIQNSIQETAKTSFRNGVFRSEAFLFSGVLVILSFSYGKIGKNLTAFGIVAIIIFDLFSFGMRYMITFDIREVYLDNEVISFLKQDSEPFRMLAPDFDPNIGVVSGLETLSGYGTLTIKRFSEFISLSQGISPDIQNLLLKLTETSVLADLMNTRYVVVSSTEKLKNPPFSPVFANNRLCVYRNNNSFPRAFIVHSAKIIKDKISLFRELISPLFNPKVYAIVEDEIRGLPDNLEVAEHTPRFKEYSPNRIKIDADLAKPGLLILGDIYFPGWKAFVDGEEAHIHRANYIMRAVKLPAGGHTVEFCYDPDSFKFGGIISLLSLILAVGSLISIRFSTCSKD